MQVLIKQASSEGNELRMDKNSLWLGKVGPWSWNAFVVSPQLVNFLLGHGWCGVGKGCQYSSIQRQGYAEIFKYFLYKELLRRTTCDFELVGRHYAPSHRIEDELRHPAIDRLEHHLYEKMNSLLDIIEQYNMQEKYVERRYVDGDITSNVCMSYHDERNIRVISNRRGFWISKSNAAWMSSSTSNSMPLNPSTNSPTHEHYTTATSRWCFIPVNIAISDFLFSSSSSTAVLQNQLLNSQVREKAPLRLTIMVSGILSAFVGLGSSVGWAPAGLTNVFAKGVSDQVWDPLTPRNSLQ